MTRQLSGQKVLLGYSGGPDAAALAYKLHSCGATVFPVYINYRKTLGGKSTKDLRAAHTSVNLLDTEELIEIRAPLRDRPKSERNRFFIETLSSLAQSCNAHYVALGTLSDGIDEDLDPALLGQYAEAHGTEIITWDSFGIREKADQFSNMGDNACKALFQTTSCQMWWKVECGNCHSCIARHQSFLKAFGHDPTTYRLHSKIQRQ